MDVFQVKIIYKDTLDAYIRLDGAQGIPVTRRYQALVDTFRSLCRMIDIMIPKYINKRVRDGYSFLFLLVRPPRS